MTDILMATYNGEKYIKKQLESLIAQTDSEWRLFIHDDGSDDDTKKIVKEFKEFHPQYEIHLIEDGICTGGAKNNFCHLLRYTDSAYVMFCDQDDVWKPEKIEITLRQMKKAEAENGKNCPILVHGEAMVFDDESKKELGLMSRYQSLEPERGDFSDVLVQGNVTGCTMMVNRALLEICEEIPEKAIMHDWWFSLAAAAFGKIYFINEPLILYCQHGDNTVGAKKVTSPLYVAKRVFAGGDIKASLKKTYEQAKVFKTEFYGKLTPENAGVLDDYISLETASKPRKIRILLKRGFTKSGLLRKMAYWIYV